MRLFDLIRKPIQPPQAAPFHTTYPKFSLMFVELNVMYIFKVIYFMKIAFDLISISQFTFLVRCENI